MRPDGIRRVGVTLVAAGLLIVVAAQRPGLGDEPGSSSGSNSSSGPGLLRRGRLFRFGSNAGSASSPAASTSAPAPAPPPPPAAAQPLGESSPPLPDASTP